MEIVVDAQGVSHLTCGTDSDCLTALGYFQASHDFWMMDVYRRYGRGRLASLFGEAALEGDQYERLYNATALGQPLEDAILGDLEPDSHELLDAFASGVNAWLEDLVAGRNGARLSEEYSVPGFPRDIAERLPRWEPQDSIAILISGMRGSEVAWDALFSRLRTGLGDEAFADLVLPIPASRSTIVPHVEALRATPSRRAHAQAPPSSSLIDGAWHRLERSQRRLQELGIEQGSNNWAVAASQSASGQAILAADPHGSLGNPPAAFLVEVDARTHGTGRIHVTGASLPGLPLFNVAMNQDVAWGVTVSAIDGTDHYLETLTADGRGVIFEGGEVAFVEDSHSFDVYGDSPRTATLQWVPHHGPLIWQEGGSGVSARWIGHDGRGDVDGLFDLMRAADLDEGLDAIDRMDAIGLNVIVADATGRIGWALAGRIPRRPWATLTQPPWLVLPGDGTAEWQGFLRADEEPRMVDPPSGILATANNPIDDEWFDGDPTNGPGPYLQSFSFSDFRHQRIMELLSASAGAHTVEDSGALQADTFIHFATGIVPAILEAADGGPLTEAARRAVDTLREWEWSCPTGLTGVQPDSLDDPDEVAARESIGCTVYHTAAIFLCRQAFLDEYRAGQVDDAFSEALLIRALYSALVRPEDQRTGEALWDDVSTAAVESRDETIRAALEAAADHLATFDAEPNGWRWGRVHTLTLHSILRDPARDLGPFANDGGYVSVDPGAFDFSRGRFDQTVGPMVRMIFELSPGANASWAQLPGGLDLHRDSPFYDNLVEPYLRNEYFAVSREGNQADHLQLVP